MELIFIDTKRNHFDFALRYSGAYIAFLIVRTINPNFIYPIFHRNVPFPWNRAKFPWLHQNPSIAIRPGKIGRPLMPYRYMCLATCGSISFLNRLYFFAYNKMRIFFIRNNPNIKLIFSYKSFTYFSIYQSQAMVDTLRSYPVDFKRIWIQSTHLQYFIYSWYVPKHSCVIAYLLRFMKRNLECRLEIGNCLIQII
ncbi:hypothetical protein D1872_185520 [compost metagenome]